MHNPANNLHEAKSKEQSGRQSARGENRHAGPAQSVLACRWLFFVQDEGLWRPGQEPKCSSSTWNLLPFQIGLTQLRSLHCACGQRRQ